MDIKTIAEETYDRMIEGVSAFSGELVQVIGEKTVLVNNDFESELYIYTINNYKSSNGKPFEGLKANIMLLK